MVSHRYPGDEYGDLEFDSSDPTKAYLLQAAQERELKRIVDERIQFSGGDNNRNNNKRRIDVENFAQNDDQYQKEDLNQYSSSASNAVMSDSARVKTMWEKTLNSSSRVYLDAVHLDTSMHRATTTATNSSAYSATAGTSIPSLKGDQIPSAKASSDSSGDNAGIDITTDVGVVGNKRSLKEERLELIRQKRNKLT